MVKSGQNYQKPKVSELHHEIAVDRNNHLSTKTISIYCDAMLNKIISYATQTELLCTWLIFPY